MTHPNFLTRYKESILKRERTLKRCRRCLGSGSSCCLAPDGLCTKSRRQGEFPALPKARWPRQQENAAKRHHWSGRGGSFNYRIIGDWNQPPRPLRQESFAPFFLMSRPPLLGAKEGNFALIRRFVQSPPDEVTNQFSILIYFSDHRCLHLRMQGPRG
jgi:hypothetical protein